MLNPAALFGALPGAVAQGIIWGIMALGVYMTFKILDFADMTVDATMATGGAIGVMLVIAGVNPALALLFSFVGGLLCGTVTGLLHTVLGIPSILSGILTQFALWSVNLVIMGKANTPLSVDKYPLIVTLRDIPRSILVSGLIAVAVVLLFYWYFGTEQGSSIRATGANIAMARAQGVNTDFIKVLTLALSNGLVALSGGLLAQYQGFADVSMGRGAIVIGLAAVVIGEVLGTAILRKHLNFMGRLVFTACGGVVYYIVLQIVLWLRLPTDYTKMFTAIIVAVFLSVPYLKGKYFKKNLKKEAQTHA
ncbi:MAG: ABC transporter permease [Gemmiger sp.]|nr:ABC transporter permease [Gemmiger sp.]